MAKVAYVMLAHEQPSLVAEHAGLITAADPRASVVIHYDASVGETKFQMLRSSWRHAAVALAEKRAGCGWGEFGLVKGSSSPFANRASEDRTRLRVPDQRFVPPDATSRRTEPLPRRTGRQGVHPGPRPELDKRGLRRSVEFFFPVNFQNDRWLFDRLVKLHRRLRIRRKIPGRLQPRFGSQWWCLTWNTCRGVLDYLDAHPRFTRFFRSTSIRTSAFPDFGLPSCRSADRQRVADAPPIHRQGKADRLL